MSNARLLLKPNRLHDPHASYTTADELEYVTNIGSFAEGAALRSPADFSARRITLLRTYIANAPKREWGVICSSACVNAATMMLAKLEGVPSEPVNATAAIAIRAQAQKGHTEP
jgi:hypothetical protein